MLTVLLWSSTAFADRCLCLEWETEWQWSDCPTGQECPCGCSDAVDTGSDGDVCSEAGLEHPPRTDAECMLVEATCVVQDCCDELVTDCPDEEPTACGCVTPTGGLPVGAALLVALGVWRSRQLRVA